MTRSVDFIFDFGSPNSYLAFKALGSYPELSKASINLIPCLLGGIFKATGNQPPMAAFAGVKGKLEYEMIEIRRYCETHGLNKFTFNPHFPINTLALMRGLIAAELENCKVPYIKAVLTAMWEDGKNMNDPAIFAAVLTDAGLDADLLLAKSQSPDVKQKLIDNTVGAVARGVFGLPAFFVGDEMYFGKDRLGQIEAAITAGPI